MPSASEWLQDNFFLVQRAIRQIQEAMPVGYLRRLPRLQASSGAPVTRVEAIALALVEHCHAAVAIDHITRFVETYQETSSLTLGELWALPTMLRFGALCLLARVLGNLLGIPIPENLSTDPVLNRLTESVNPESLVGSAISSLRTLDTQPWTVFLESVSQVELTLRQDPLNAYSTMDADTRDRYRRAVETIARHSGKPEYEVAERIVQLAEAALTSSGSSSDGIVQAPRQAHVGYYLMDAGRLIVEAELGCRIPRDEHIRRWMKRHAAWAYPAVIAGTSLSAAFVAAYCVHCAGGSWLQIGATALLACIPASIAIVAWINWLVMRIVPPVALPKMDFSRAVAPEYRTMVAIPVIFGSVDDVDATLRRLEQHYISNQDPQIRFALLTDVADAPVQDMPEDADIIDRAATGIKALNEKYAEADGSSPFILCHRTRAWNENEGAWMGWERKRGKLEELARLLRGEETSYTLMVGDVGLATPTRYVITLDADTRLPGGTARRLIGALAHPLNQAVLDPRTGEVDAGYTVLQPRMGITPSSASASTFARIYATDSAIDLYSRAVSDVYQDMVGEGIYAGKGIYDVEAFDRCLNGRVPENALLSHDLFEGLHGRAALVTDIVLYESYPPDYLSYSHRLHRWVRGDWQLLPWLFSRVPGKDGRRIANKLSLIDRWKVLDNLRRSLQTPALLALLVAGWLWLPGHPGIWTFGALLASGAHLVTALLDLAAATIHRRAHPLHESVYHSLLRWLLSLVFLPYEAILMLDAVLTTLVRVYVTHQHLLQWTTAAHTVRLLGKQR
ncbi:MAG: cellobiose phosphorylase, partial [Chloroflexi bacterium]|nr:cellobiose phosphorylase [Chloroflexota bacterium]